MATRHDSPRSEGAGGAGRRAARPWQGAAAWWGGARERRAARGGGVGEAERREGRER